MIACVYLPYFAPLILRSPQPLIVVRHFQRRGKVIAYAPDAEKLSITRGLGLTRARALCPQGNFVSADDPAFASAHERLLNTLWVYTNRVELDAAAYPHHVRAYLDLGTLRPDDARRLAEEMAAAVSAAFGSTPGIGLARGKLTAALAALQPGMHLVSPSDEARFIAPASIDVLPLIKDEARWLHLLGLHTLGDLAELPRAALASALGKRGTLLHRLASGLDGRPVTPAAMPQQESIRLTFEPLAERDYLDDHLQRAITEMAHVLERRGSAAHRLCLTLYVHRGKAQTETLRLLDPVGSTRGIGEIVGRLLDRMCLSGEVVGIELCAAHLVTALPIQLELFGARPTSKGVIDLTRALAARYGTEELFTVAVGQHRSLLLERRYVRQRIVLEGDEG